MGREQFLRATTGELSDLKKIAGTDQTARDWSDDFSELKNLAKALQTNATDELISRISDSGGTQIDPATAALENALKTNDTDELISRITDSGGTEIDPTIKGNQLRELENVGTAVRSWGEGTTGSSVTVYTVPAGVTFYCVSAVVSTNDETSDHALLLRDDADATVMRWDTLTNSNSPGLFVPPLVVPADYDFYGENGGSAIEVSIWGYEV